MKDIEIRDAVYLRELTAVLPNRAAASIWDVVDFVDRDGEAYFEIAGGGGERFDVLANTGRRIAGAEFLAEALLAPQVIWGTFRAFDDSDAVTPWLILDAVDSTFWRVRTRDILTRQAMLRTFRRIKQTSW